MDYMTYIVGNGNSVSHPELTQFVLLVMVLITIIIAFYRKVIN